MSDTKSATLKRLLELRDLIRGAVREVRAIARRHNVAVNGAVRSMSDEDFNEADHRIPDAWEDGIIGVELSDAAYASRDVQSWFEGIAETVRIGERWIAAGKPRKRSRPRGERG